MHQNDNSQDKKDSYLIDTTNLDLVTLNGNLYSSRWKSPFLYKNSLFKVIIDENVYEYVDEIRCQWSCRNDKLYITSISYWDGTEYENDTEAIALLGEDGMFAQWVTGNISLLLDEQYVENGKKVLESYIILTFDNGVKVDSRQHTVRRLKQLRNYIEE